MNPIHLYNFNEKKEGYFNKIIITKKNNSLNSAIINNRNNSCFLGNNSNKGVKNLNAAKAYSINEIDYVIIHELCHFLEFNHSRNFWKYVKKYKNDYKEIQKVLKKE